MKKKSLIAAFIIILAILIAFAFLYFPIGKSDKLVMDAYSKNNTWQIWLTKDVPYKIWDEIEFINIIRWWDYIANLDISKLYKEMEIESITLNWKAVWAKDLKNVKVSSTEPSILDIKWKAIKNKTSDSSLIDIKDEVASKEPQITKEKVVDTKIKASNISFSASSFSSNLNNLLEINWKNLESIKYVLIWEKSYNPIAFGWKIYIQIDKNTFSSWDYFVIFQLSNWDILTSDTKLHFEYSNNKINIWNITPSRISNNIDRYIVLQWNGFNKLMSMQLSNNLIFKNTEFKIINDNVVSVKIPKWIEPWSYHLNLMDTVWIYESKWTQIIINN